MKSNKDVFFVLVATEKVVNIFSPTSRFELKLFPIEIHELAISFFVESYYFHTLFIFVHIRRCFQRQPFFNQPTVVKVMSIEPINVKIVHCVPSHWII